jgi:hypothetical protein
LSFTGCIALAGRLMDYQIAFGLGGINVEKTLLSIIMRELSLQINVLSDEVYNK